MSHANEPPITRLTGKIAVVTGAGRGIGAATAVRFAREGATVAVLDLDTEAVNETSERIGEVGGEAAGWTVDVTDPVQLEVALREINARFGALDILHANAGILRAGTADEVTREDWDATMSVNVAGVLNAARAALPDLRAGGGAIVITASTAGIVGEQAKLAYCTSKGAVVAMTRQMATDYAADRVRVNCVCPGWVDTTFSDQLLEDIDEQELAAILQRQVPLGRQGAPEEVASAVAFLASEDAAYVTGAALVVDGGMTSAQL